MMNAKKADLKFEVRFSSQINGSHPLTFVESRWCSLHTMIATAINKNGGILQLFLNGISLHIRIFEFIKLQIKYPHRGIMIISFFSLPVSSPLSKSIVRIHCPSDLKPHPGVYHNPFHFPRSGSMVVSCLTQLLSIFERHN